MSNPSMRLLWHEYCADDAVSTGTFLRAVERFLEEHLHLSDTDVAMLLDDANKAAIVRAVSTAAGSEVAVAGKVAFLCRVLSWAVPIPSTRALHSAVCPSHGNWAPSCECFVVVVWGARCPCRKWRQCSLTRQRPLWTC